MKKPDCLPGLRPHADTRGSRPVRDVLPPTSAERGGAAAPRPNHERTLPDPWLRRDGTRAAAVPDALHAAVPVRRRAARDRQGPLAGGGQRSNRSLQDTGSARGRRVLDLDRGHAPERIRAQAPARNSPGSSRRVDRGVRADQPGHLHVLHHCDNPPCVRPSHLFLGTDADNVQDMLAKGREARNYGDDHHNIKLTDAQVAEIRALREQGLFLHTIADRTRVDPSHIGKIVRGQAGPSPAVGRWRDGAVLPGRPGHPLPRRLPRDHGMA